MALPSALPGDWNTYGPGEKIDYFNTMGVTPEDLMSVGVGQGDIDWMRNNGYIVGLPQVNNELPIETEAYTGVKPGALASVAAPTYVEPTPVEPQPVYVEPQPVAQEPVYTRNEPIYTDPEPVDVEPEPVVDPFQAKYGEMEAILGAVPGTGPEDYAWWARNKTPEEARAFVASQNQPASPAPSADNWMSGVAFDQSKLPANFDWQNYLTRYSDLGAAGIDTPLEAQRHYALYGATEGRQFAPEVANQDAVKNLYQSILGREADPEGLAYWASQFGSDVSPEEEAAFRQAAQAEIAARPPAGGLSVLKVGEPSLLAANRFYDPNLKQEWAIESAADYGYGYGADRDRGSDGLVYINPTTGQALTRSEYLQVANTPEAVDYRAEQERIAAENAKLFRPGNTLDNPLAGLTDFGEEGLASALATNPNIANALGHASTFVRPFKVVNGQLQEVPDTDITPQDIASGNTFFFIGGATGGPNRQRMAQLYQSKGDQLVPVGDPSFYQGEHPDQGFKDFLSIALPLGLAFVPGLGAAVGSALGAGTGALGAAVGSGVVNFGSQLLMGAKPVDALKSSVLSAGAGFVGSQVASMLPAELAGAGKNAVTQLIATGKLDPAALATSVGTSFATDTLAAETGLDKATAGKLVTAGIQAFSGNELAALTSLAQAGLQSGLSGTGTTASSSQDRAAFLEANASPLGAGALSLIPAEDEQIALNQLNQAATSLVSDYVAAKGSMEPTDLAEALSQLTDPYGKPLQPSEVNRLVSAAQTQLDTQLRNDKVQSDTLSILGDYTGLNSDLSRESAYERLVAAGNSGERANEILNSVDTQVEANRAARATTAAQNQAAIAAGAGEFAGSDQRTAVAAGAGEFAGADTARATSEAISSAKTFGEAYAAARQAYGAGATFNWNGKLYSTDTFQENPALGLVPVAGSGRGTATGKTAEQEAALNATAEELRKIDPVARAALVDPASIDYGAVSPEGNTQGLSQTAADKLVQSFIPVDAIKTAFGMTAEAAGNTAKAIGTVGEALGFNTAQMSDFGRKLENIAQEMYPQALKQSEDEVKARFASAKSGADLATAIKDSVFNNFGAVAKMIGVEGIQELPNIALAVATGGAYGAVRYAGLLAGLGLDVVESAGLQGAQKVEEGLAKGLSRAAAVKGAVDDMKTAGVVTTLMTAAADRVPFGGTIAKTLIKGSASEGAEEYVIARATGADHMSALRQAAFGALIGGPTEASLQGAGNLTSVVINGDAMVGTYADGTKVTITEPAGATELKIDVTTPSVVTSNVTSTLTSDLTSGVDLNTAISNVVTANVGSDLSGTIDSTVKVLVGNNVNLTQGVSDLTSSALTTTGDTKTVVNQVVSSLASNSVDLNANAGSVVSGALGGGASVNTAVKDTLTAVVGNGGTAASAAPSIIDAVSVKTGGDANSVTNAASTIIANAGGDKNAAVAAITAAANATNGNATVAADLVATVAKTGNADATAAAVDAAITATNGAALGATVTSALNNNANANATITAAVNAAIDTKVQAGTSLETAAVGAVAASIGGGLNAGASANDVINAAVNTAIQAANGDQEVVASVLQTSTAAGVGAGGDVSTVVAATTKAAVDGGISAATAAVSAVAGIAASGGDVTAAATAASNASGTQVTTSVEGGKTVITATSGDTVTRSVVDAASQTTLTSVTDLKTNQTSTTVTDASTQQDIANLQESVGQIKTDLTAKIDASIKAGQDADAAIQTALDQVAASVGTTKTDLLAQLGTTEAALKQDFTAALQTGLSGLESKLSTAISDARSAGATGDAALQKAIESLASDLGTTKEGLLSQLGTTEAALKTDFASQLTDVSKTLNDAIAASIKAGQDADTALNTSISKVASDLGLTKEQLLNQIGKTESALKGDVKTLSDTVTKINTDLTTEIKNVLKTTQDADAVLNTSINKVASDLGLTKDQLLNQIGKTESQLKTEIQTTQDTITQVKTDLTTQINTLAKTTADADKIITGSIEKVAEDLGLTKKELLDTIGETEVSLKAELATELGKVAESLGKEIKGIKTGLASAAAIAAAQPIRGVSLDDDWLKGRMLQAGRAEGYRDPLAQFQALQEEAQREEMIKQIEPALAEVLMQRETPYYSYGEEAPIDDILGLEQEESEAEPVFRMGGSVSPLNIQMMYARGGQMREDFRQGKHVAGEGDGQSDDIPAWLADGEFVFPADVVSALGNGSTKAGTDMLYEMMHEIRKRARSKGPKDLPPPAHKSPLDYLKSRK